MGKRRYLAARPLSTALSTEILLFQSAKSEVKYNAASLPIIEYRYRCSYWWNLQLVYPRFLIWKFETYFPSASLIGIVSSHETESDSHHKSWWIYQSVFMNDPPQGGVTASSEMCPATSSHQTRLHQNSIPHIATTSHGGFYSPLHWLTHYGRVVDPSLLSL